MMSNEPVGIGALVVAFVNALIQALQLLGVFDLTADQLAGVNAVVITGVVLIAAIVTRSKVKPV